MSLKDELDAYVQKTVDEQWERRAGQKVPDAGDLPLKNLAEGAGRRARRSCPLRGSCVFDEDGQESQGLVCCGGLQELSLLCSEDHSSAGRYHHGLRRGSCHGCVHRRLEELRRREV